MTKICPSVFKSAGISLSHKGMRKSYPSAFKSAGIGHFDKGIRKTCPNAFKSARIGRSHKGMRKTCPSAFGLPIPAFLKNAAISLLWQRVAKALTKSASIGLSITAVCKNAREKMLGQDDFFVVTIYASCDGPIHFET